MSAAVVLVWFLRRWRERDGGVGRVIYAHISGDASRLPWLGHKVQGSEWMAYCQAGRPHTPCPSCAHARVCAQE